MNKVSLTCSFILTGYRGNFFFQTWRISAQFTVLHVTQNHKTRDARSQDAIFPSRTAVPAYFPVIHKTNRKLVLWSNLQCRTYPSLPPDKVRKIRKRRGISVFVNYLNASRELAWYLKNSLDNRDSMRSIKDNFIRVFFEKEG